MTAYTTFDHLDARAVGEGWSEAAVAVLDVESPAGGRIVRLGLELDPSDLDRLPHHVDYVPLTPEQARSLADDLTEAAAAAEQDEEMTSGRS